MKPQIFSMRKAPVGIIGFLLLLTTTPIGCAILSNAYPVMSLRSRSPHTGGPPRQYD